MKWKMPPRIKIYEALGAIGDKRILIDEADEFIKAIIYSTDKKKYYEVKYDEKSNAIISNDSGSYWQGYLGYPSIAILMLKGRIRYDVKCSEALENINWKDINNRFKHDYEKTEEFVVGLVAKKLDVNILKIQIDDIMLQITNLGMEKSGPRLRPPKEDE